MPIIAEEKVILELKVAKGLSDAHKAQTINYLKATDIEVGLILNLGPKPEFIRKVFSNSRKSLKDVLFDR